MTTVSTRYFRIQGHVQGVGFRYWTQQQARRLGLSGWVRNCADSTVEARATGGGDQLDALEQWLQHGPRGARVDRVDSSIPDDEDAGVPASGTAGFEILR